LFSRGGTPYFSFSNHETAEKVVDGYRLDKPKKCPDDVYTLMRACWDEDPAKRPSFPEIVNRIDGMITIRQEPEMPSQTQGKKGSVLSHIQSNYVSCRKY
jgi:hypothetical protein